MERGLVLRGLLLWRWGNGEGIEGMEWWRLGMEMGMDDCWLERGARIGELGFEGMGKR